MRADMAKYHIGSKARTTNDKAEEQAEKQAGRKLDNKAEERGEKKPAGKTPRKALPMTRRRKA